MALDTTSSPERTILDLRKAGFREVVVMGRYNYNEAHHQLPAHSHHQMLEICFCSKGEQSYEVNGETFRIRGNELFVTYPGERHGTGKYPEEKGELYWIIIRLNPRIKSKQFLHFDGKLAAEWHQQLLHLPRHFKGNSSLKNKLEKVFDLYPDRKDNFTVLNLQHYVTDCLLEIINCSRQKITNKDSGRLQIINDVIHRDLDQPVSLQILAQSVGLSLSRFKTWFKEETGTTPLDYVLRYKILKAQHLLAENKMPITSIAFETGFHSSQYFASVFKKFTGLSPSDYKKVNSLIRSEK